MPRFDAAAIDPGDARRYRVCWRYVRSGRTGQLRRRYARAAALQLAREANATDGVRVYWVEDAETGEKAEASG